MRSPGPLSPSTAPRANVNGTRCGRPPGPAVARRATGTLANRRRASAASSLIPPSCPPCGPAHAGPPARAAQVGQYGILIRRASRPRGRSRTSTTLKGQHRVSGVESTSSATTSPAADAESPGPDAPASRTDVLGEIRRQRIEKVQQLRDQGIDPYPPDAVDRVSIARVCGILV